MNDPSGGVAGVFRVNPWCRIATAAATVFAVLICLPRPIGAEEPVATETIVLVRHAEKPEGGLGQLDCQGLNRSLALPAVVLKDFGRPSAIFAPNPSIPKMDAGVSYDYIRPLATIEPTAIVFGLPVGVSHGVDDWAALAQDLLHSPVKSGTILIAWEHVNLVKLARALMTGFGGDASVVPDWDRNDFDSIYILHVISGASAVQASFEHRQEGLNGENGRCPHPASP